VRPALFALLLVAFSSTAWAAGGGESGEHGVSWTVLAVHVLNFGFLMFLLYRYARKPILGYLADRSQGIRKEIESAEERLAHAESELAELRALLASFDDEARSIVDTARAVAEQEKARQIERAHETATRIREDAERVAGQELERARQTLRAEAAELATQLAAELLREQMTQEDDQRMVGEFVERLGGSQ
jgi:F-type H+-transporting ATPase subunit b